MHMHTKGFFYNVSLEETGRDQSCTQRNGRDLEICIKERQWEEVGEKKSLKNVL